MIRRVDRYELLEQVGSGGMAVVYRGHDTALDREVAVKLLHPHLAVKAESRARFSREARAVARLRHPNVVAVYDYAGDAAVESYLVTEFVPGRTLRSFTEEEKLGFPEVGALVARALADALAHAHAAGVIHRDLKPENVLVLESGARRAIKLVDFGIARILTSDERMTMTGALVGSPNHMAPEIIAGRDADERSDVFSLGTILYWLATGTLPFDAPNPTATLRRVIDADFADPRDLSPLLSDELAEVIRQALSSEPASRTESAAALRDAIDAALAASGLVDSPAELEAFLADPPGYKASLRGRLVAEALARADAALTAREPARGMRLLDRVLALQPGNVEVARRLKRITSLALWRRRGRGAAVALALLLVTSAVAWALGTRRPALGAISPGAGQRRWTPAAAQAARPGSSAPAKGVPERRDASTPPPLAAGAPGREPLAEERAAREFRPPRLARAPARGAEGATPAIVNVHVRPYAQRALLDGVEVASGEQRVAFRLSRGAPHRIQIDHACCFPFVRDFTVAGLPSQPLELKVPLLARPAELRVDADPAARVFVDGKLVGNAGDSQRSPIRIPVPSTGDTPYESTAELRLESAGRPPVRATLRLRAGAEVTFAATEPQPAAGAAQPAGPGGDR